MSTSSRHILLPFLLLMGLSACTQPKPAETSNDTLGSDPFVLSNTPSDSLSGSFPDSLSATSSMGGSSEDCSKLHKGDSSLYVKSTSSNSRSICSSSDSESDSNDDDYWDQKRKTSPNSNYLVGFDEDVDDVHDMELYIDDY